MSALPPGLLEQVTAWMAADPDDRDRTELGKVFAAAQDGDPASAADLADRFAAPLRFGTAGLRGPLRAGPGGMNTAVIRRTAAGLAAVLSGDPATAGGLIAIGYDARHRSAEFAADSAAVFTAAGFGVHLLPQALPTPVLAFAVQRLGAVAGVMVTASHNPPQDNGYKVYAADGAQIIGPFDRAVESAIAAVGPAREVPVYDALPETNHPVVTDNSVETEYVRAVAALVQPGGARELRVVHTSLHGVGARVLRSVFATAGFAEPIEVPAQADPDPDFPTVAFPNPEEPGAMDLALALAAESDADIVIANDPDADRCAVGIPIDQLCGEAAGWRMLTGDQVGVLLADWLMRQGKSGTYATTIVSSSMLSVMARRYGVGFAETLTGFKWISRAATDLVFGYEEALGYAVAPALVRDKDGISAALVIAEMAAAYRAYGSSLGGRLTELTAEFGDYRTRQLSWRVAQLSEIDEAMARLRASVPGTLLDEPVTATDLLPDNDVLILRMTSGRIVIRPSGTEPKLKAYLEVVGPGVAGTAAPARSPEDALAELADVIASLLGL